MKRVILIIILIFVISSAPTQQIHAHVLVLTFKYSFRDEFNFRGERGASIRMHHQHCFAILKLYL